MLTRVTKTLLVSLDWDGCVFNLNFLYSDKVNNVIYPNEKLFSNLDEIIKKNNYDKVILMVGSNRQSHDLDVA